VPETPLSPDGMYYWDGTNWVSTLSHDGRSRWNGSAWIPVGSPQIAPGGYYPPARTTREPTSWTKPLQYAVAAWYVLSAIYFVSLPFWMSGPMSQVLNQSIQRQQALNPSATPLPADFASTMGSFMTGTLWVAAFIGVVICAVAVIGALNRWTWLYYVVLVLLGLTTISIPLNIVSAVSASALSSTSGFSMPSWIYLTGILFSIPAVALFVWMLVAQIKHGPWAMRRI
jgi:hypothetical protein